MTQAPRSGSGRGNPRGPRKPGGSGAAGGRTGSGKDVPWGRSGSGDAPRQQDRGPAERPERGQSGSGRGAPGRGAPNRGATGQSGSGRGATGQGAPGKSAAKGAANSTPRGQFPGPRPFGRERFGMNLGPVQRPQRGVRRSNPVPSDQHDPDGIRLQKILAGAGVASRRVCEDMIEAGRVEVDGVIVRELGVRVDPKKAAIHVDGIRIQLDETMTYYVFNKPKGVVSTMEDPEGRKCISDFLKNKSGERLFHVGRLDVATEGLLLLTNDGELANRLTHPSYEVPKTYLVQVRGPMAQGIGAQMREGIELEDGIASVDSFRLVDSTPGHVLVEVVLHSGRNRIVRRMFDAVGHPVERLVRVKFGPIGLGDQRQGSIRALGRQEVGHLMAAVGL